VTSPVIEARPIKSARIGYAAAAFVLATFVVVAILMRKDNAGAHFGPKDQLFTVVIGVILGGMCLMLTRPRLHADAEAVRLRNFLGGWRTVPWSVIERVEFPSNARFARVVLPAEEILAIYAVQRLDRDRAVETMRALRALFSATHTSS